MTGLRRKKQKEQEDLDVLIAESQRIRDELLKTTGKLDAFTALLAAEADQLKAEAEQIESNDGE